MCRSQAARGSSDRTSCAPCSIEVTCFASSTTFSTGSRENVASVDVEIVEGELRSFDRVHYGCSGRRGGVPSRSARLGPAVGSGSADVECRQRGRNTQRPAGCADEGVRRVVFSSSSSVYGTRRKLPVTEATLPRSTFAAPRRKARGRAVKSHTSRYRRGCREPSRHSSIDCLSVIGRAGIDAMPAGLATPRASHGRTSR